MRNFIRSFFKIAPLFATLLVVLLLNCNGDKETIPFETDERGYFYTFDLGRAQEEIVFDIVLPEYLPPDIGKCPHIQGPLQGTVLPDEIQININYLTQDDDHKGIIKINECSYPCVQPAPELNEGYEYIEIRGVRIVKGEHFVDGQVFTFGWNQNNTYFIVAIYDYSYEQALRIVESMIRQD